MKFNHYLKLALFIFATSAAVCFHLPDTAYSASGSASASDDFFEQQIRPLFVTNCQRCHNATKHMAGLDLSSAEGFARGSASGALVNKENPFASLLLKVISYDDELKMPPSGKLKDEGIAAMTAWVKLGAPWPGAAPTVAAAPVRSTVRALTAEEKNYWAFQPISHASAPKIKNTRWVKSPLDRQLFVDSINKDNHWDDPSSLVYLRVEDIDFCESSRSFFKLLMNSLLLSGQKVLF